MPTVKDGASNGVLDRFPTRIVDVIDFHDCSQGLGLKIFGGLSSRGDDHGIFVKEIVPGGLAALSGRVQPGDQLLEVNGRPLAGVTNAKAVSLLRACAAQRILTLISSRDTEAYRGYHKLCNGMLSGSVQSLNVSDNDHHSTLSRGRPRHRATSELYNNDLDTTTSEGQVSPVSQLSTSTSTHVGPKSVYIDYRTGLGMSICGGTNKAEGPGIYIDSVIKGGDVHRQGILQPGDEIVSVNGHVLQGLTHERAMKILTRLKLRQVKQVEVRYREGAGVSPRKTTASARANGIKKSSSRGNISTNSGAVGHLSNLASPQPSNSALPRSSPGYNPTSSTSNLTSPGYNPTSSTSNLTSPGHNLTPSASRGSLNTSRASPANNRTLSDTASNFLNTRLEDGSAPLRASSLAPGQQVNMDKLVVALQYLGYNPTPEQLETLKGKLTIGAGNKVKYADFVTAAREVFAYKLKDSSRVLKSDSMDDISRSRAELNKSLNTLTSDHSKRGRKAPDLSNSVPDLSLHKDELRSASSLGNPASSLLGHVTGRNRSQLQSAESAVSGYSGWSLPQYDKDYSNVDTPELIRECAILAAELRKSEGMILQYKGVIERLVSFAQNVQSSFKAEVSRSRSLERGTPMDRSRTRQSLATVIHGATKTIKDAQEVLHEAHLPQGWEEAFTEDGAKYYVNHLTQSTSWDRPTT